MKTLVTIRYVSGREEKFEMELWTGGGAQARLKEFAEKPNLLLQTNDEVIIIPAPAIECISIKLPPKENNPPPLNLPELRHATRIN